MSAMYLLLPKPTRLYIKQCPKTGLKYFGKHDGPNVETYSGSGKWWKRHLKKHKVKPVHLWNSDWYYDTSITRFALLFSKLNNIVESKEWANITLENGKDGGDNSEHIDYDSIKQTKQTSEYLQEVELPRRKRLSEIQNDPVWKSTFGAEANRKRLSHYENKEWLENVKKPAQKIIADKNRVKWKDENWIEEVGKPRNDSISKTRKDPNWKKENYIICEHCGKESDPGNHKRWHGDKCKHK